MGIEPNLYNNFKEIPIEINWDTYEIIVKSVLKDKQSTIVIYADRLYINEQLLVLDNMYDSRIK